MTELDELPDLLETDPKRLPSEIPTAPENYRPTMPVEFDFETSDAPDWAKQMHRINMDRRDEERALLSRIEKNQKLYIKEVRRISRRVGELESDVEDIRERLEGAEDRLDDLESET